MSFLGACSLARIGSTSQQLRIGATGLLARSHVQPAAAVASYSSSSIEPKEPPKGNNPAASPLGENAAASVGSRTHRVNNLERRLLVFTKKYKSIDDVPTYINQDVMERCRNQVRIKMANYMMLATAIGCLIMIFSGKKAQERGDSVAKMNLDWHKEYNEKTKQEIAKSEPKN